MKKIAILGALLFATGCGDTVYVQNTTPDTIGYIPPPPTAEETFVDTIQGEYPLVVQQMGDAWVIRFGKLACSAIDEGNTLEDFAAMAVSNDVDPAMIGFLIGAAIPAFCPENQWFIDAYANA